MKDAALSCTNVKRGEKKKSTPAVNCVLKNAAVVLLVKLELELLIVSFFLSLSIKLLRS